MAAHTGQPTRSRRFIKLYLSIWALLASGALAYLAVLAFPPHAAPPEASLEPARSPTTEVAVRQVKTMEVKALAEVQGSLSEIRKDVSELQVAVDERVVNEKVVETRLTVLEERVSTIEPQQPPAALSGLTTPEKSMLAATEPPFRPVSGPQATPTTSVLAATPIETGSIVHKPREEIVFGEPVVTRAKAPELAVQVAAGPSLEAMKESWGQLSGQHAGALSALRPRVVAPRGKSRNYRLIAGPVATEADAARICAEVGPQTCFVTPYAGAPL